MTYDKTTGQFTIRGTVLDTKTVSSEDNRIDRFPIAQRGQFEIGATVEFTANGNEDKRANGFDFRLITSQNEKN